MDVLLPLLFLVIPGSFLIFIATAPRRNHRKEMQFWLDRKIQEYDSQLKKKKISKAMYNRLVREAHNKYNVR
jgi:hypothetical protein